MALTLESTKVYGKTDTPKNTTITLPATIGDPAVTAETYFFRKDANINITAAITSPASMETVAIDGTKATAGAPVILNNTVSIKAALDGCGIGIKMNPDASAGQIISNANKKSAITIAVADQYGAYGIDAFNAYHNPVDSTLVLGSETAVDSMTEKFYTAINLSGKDETIGIRASRGLKLAADIYGNMTVTGGDPGWGGNAYGYYVNGAKNADGITGGADFFNTITVTANDGDAAAFITNLATDNVSVTLGDLNNVTVNAKKTGNAYGIYATGDIKSGNLKGTVKITSAESYAAAFYSVTGNISIGDILKGITVSGAQNVYGINTVWGSVSVGDIAGAVKVTSKYKAYGFYGNQGVNVGNITKNIDVTGVRSAYGIIRETPSGADDDGNIRIGDLNGNLTVKAAAAKKTAYAAEAYGIATGSSCAIDAGNITKNITVSATSEGAAATAYGIRGNLESSGAVSGKITVTATGKSTAGSKTEAYGIANSQSGLELTRKLTVKATDKTGNGSAEALGANYITSLKDLEVTADAAETAAATGVESGGTATGTVTVKAVSKNAGATAAGFNGDTEVNALNVTATGANGATATGIGSSAETAITKSANITAKAAGGTATAALMTPGEGKEVLLDLTGAAVTVSATGANMQGNEAFAYGVNGVGGKELTVSGITKKVSISAAGFRAMAYFIPDGENVIITDGVTGSVNVTATAVKGANGGNAAAYGIQAEDGTVTLGEEIGTWNIKASGKTAEVYGIKADTLVLSDDELSGGINVSGTTGAAVSVKTIAAEDEATPVLGLDITATGANVTGLELRGDADFALIDGEIEVNGGRGIAIDARNAGTTAQKLTLADDGEVEGDIYLGDGGDAITMLDDSEITANLLDFGGGIDVLNLYSGAELKGTNKNTSSISGLDTLNLYLTDGKKAPSALIQNFSSTGTTATIHINLGMTGNFVLANNVQDFMAAEYLLLDGTVGMLNTTINGIRYELVQSGTKHILKATVDTESGNVYSTKQTDTVVLDGAHTHFTAAANVDITAKNEPGMPATGIMVNGTEAVLVLDNTVKMTNKQAVAEVRGIRAENGTLTLISNTNGKSAVTVTADSAVAYGVKAKNVVIGSADGVMEQFYTSVSATSAQDTAHGYHALNTMTAYADMTGKITVKGGGEAAAFYVASSSGTAADCTFDAQNIDGAVSVTSTGTNTTDDACFIAAGKVNTGDIEGAVSVTAKAGWAYGIKSNDNITTGDIDGNWTVKSDNYTYGLQGGDIVTGDISGIWTVTGNQACAVSGRSVITGELGIMKITGIMYACAISATTGNITIDDLEKAVTVKSGNIAKGVSSDSGSITVDKIKKNVDVTGVLTAYGIYAGKAVNLEQLAGNLTVKASGTKEETRTIRANGITSLNDTSAIGEIKGRITVAATSRNNIAAAVGISLNKGDIDSVRGAVSATATGNSAESGTTTAKGIELNNGGAGEITAKISAKATDKGTRGTAEATALSVTETTAAKDLEAAADSTLNATATAAKLGYNDGDISASGTVTAKATSAEGTATATGATGNLTANVLNVTATAANGTEAIAIGTGGNLTLTKSANITAKAVKGNAEAALVQANTKTAVSLTGASATVSAAGDSKTDTAAANAWLINGKDKELTITGLTKTVKVTAAGCSATAFFAETSSNVVFSNDVTSTINITATAAKANAKKEIAGGTAKAYGISAESVVMQEKAGTWNIKATGETAEAYGIKAGTIRINDTLSGKISVTGTTGAAISVSEFQSADGSGSTAGNPVTLAVNITTSGSDDLVGIELKGPAAFAYENATINANKGKGLAIADNSAGTVQNILFGDKGVVKGDIALRTGDDSITMLCGSQITGNSIDFGNGSDTLSLYAGAVMKGTSNKTSTLTGVEQISFCLDNIDKGGTAMLQNFSGVTADNDGLPEIDIYILEGMTGSFQLMSGVGNTADLLSLAVDLNIGDDVNMNLDLGNIVEYSGVSYELILTGTGNARKVTLAASEMLSTSDALNSK